MDKFSELSIKLNNDLSKQERQDYGIFFTPRAARERIFNFLDSLAPKTILEPSCGSGEFISDCLVRYPKAVITGVEKHETIYSELVQSDLYTNNIKKLRLVNTDFLKASSLGKYDLVIGNPPYFVTKDKNPLCMTGRGNIFVQFIYKCLVEHLKQDGILAFVLPTSFYNCTYYSPCRDYIRNNCTILHVENIDGGYYETGQDTMIMIIRNCIDTPQFIFSRGDNNYITPFYKELNCLLQGSTTIAELGFRVKTGEVVWNQHKDKLVTNKEMGIPVIYQTNIVDGQIILDNLKASKNDEKKQYISGYSGTPMTGPAILISRGFGNKYNFVYSSIEDTNFKFYGENHINVVYCPSAAYAAYAAYATTNKTFQRIKSSLSDPRTQQFIQMFVGNGALSKTELETILPIF
jgi:adenine-specific DNA-methyltransferase